VPTRGAKSRPYDRTDASTRSPSLSSQPSGSLSAGVAAKDGQCHQPGRDKAHRHSKNQAHCLPCAETPDLGRSDVGDDNPVDRVITDGRVVEGRSRTVKQPTRQECRSES